MTELQDHSSTMLGTYLGELAPAFQRAAAYRSVRIERMCVAGVSVVLHIIGASMATVVLPALAHLRGSLTSDDAPEINLYFWDRVESNSWPPRPPFTADDYRRYGQRAIAHDGMRSVMYAPISSQLFAYDRAGRSGYYWAEDAGSLSIYERAAPAQTLFHWALAEFGWQIVHAAAVGSESAGVLLIGGTGAGKSTTALSCLAQDGLQFLSDDKCMARLEPQPEALALFSSAKIKGDMLERLPHFRPMLAGWDDSYKAAKGLVFLHPTYADHMVTSFPIKALLLPQVAHRRDAVIRPVSAGEVFRQLGPSTVIWLPGAEADNYRFTAAMVRQMPRYRIELAETPQANVDAMRTLLERLG